MISLLTASLVLAAQATSGPKPEVKPPASSPAASAVVTSAKRDTAADRCTEAGETPSARLRPLVRIVPGPPPLLSFRYYEGRMHHQFGNVDLVLDDAGH